MLIASPRTTSPEASFRRNIPRPKQVDLLQPRAVLREHQQVSVTDPSHRCNKQLVQVWTAQCHFLQTVTWSVKLTTVNKYLGLHQFGGNENNTGITASIVESKLRKK